MKHFITATIIIFSIIAVNAQDWNKVIYDWHFEAKESASAHDTYDRIEGSPFLDDDFVEGSIITRDSILYQNVPLRYNIFMDEMEFLVDSESSPMIIGSPQNFLYFRLNDKTFSYMAFIEEDTPKRGYFEVLNQEGKCRVLIRKYVTYREPVRERGYSPAKPASFINRKDSFFVKMGEQIPEEIRLRRRDILSVFDEKRDEVAGFVSDNNLSYRRVEDLIKIAEFYNQLMEE